MEGKRGSGSFRSWWIAMPLVAVIIGLAGLATLGARDLPGTGTSRRIAADLGWDPLTVLSWLILILFTFLAYTILTTPRGRMERGGGGRRRPSLFATTLLLAALAAILFFIGPGDGEGGDGGPLGLPGEGSLAEAPPAQEVGSVVTLLIFAGAVGVTIAVLVFLSHRRDREPGQEFDTGEVVATLEAAIEELEIGGDPRSVVIAAYNNMEAALGRSGVRRRQHEAPFEYIRRALGRLDVEEDSLERLTGIFQEARFSNHVIDQAMAGDAVSALGEVRRQLERV